MKIYTKTGDTGETSLYGGTRVGKDSLRVWCYGSIDEANCAMGMAVAHLQDKDEAGIKETIQHMQYKLFLAGTELASDEKGLSMLKERIQEEDIVYLEKLIDDYTEKRVQRKGFTMPGESVVSTCLHVARATVRRTERYVVALAKEEQVPPLVPQYINRLSDALYVLAEA